MTGLGKIFIGLGGLFLVIGLFLVLGGRLHLRLGGYLHIGRLPGDIVYHGKNTTFYFPIVTSILLSILLSLVLWLISRFGR